MWNFNLSRAWRTALPSTPPRVRLTRKLLPVKGGLLRTAKMGVLPWFREVNALAETAD